MLSELSFDVTDVTSTLVPEVRQIIDLGVDEMMGKVSHWYTWYYDMSLAPL